MFSSMRRISSGLLTSSGSVVACPMDLFGSRTGFTGEWLIPLDASFIHDPFTPNCSISSFSSAAASSPIVRIFMRSSLSAVLRPIPNSCEHGNGHSTRGTSRSLRMVIPLGFFISEPILASSLLGAMPIEQGRPSSSWIRCCIASAISTGVPNWLEPLISK
ncbi:hypothetical protein D1872_240180 [compost metagenome]